MKNIGLKEIANLFFSFLLIAVVSAPRVDADLSSFDQSPYTFGPEGRPYQDLQEYQKPAGMASIVPNRPVMTRDKYGVVQFWSPQGMPLATINSDGSMAFQLNGVTINKASDGTVTQKTKIIPQSNKAIITDGNGNYLGYQVLAFGYSVKQQYDNNNNLTQTYYYNEYGKLTDYIVNELTKTRTVFDSNGLPTADINYEGAVVANYVYDENSRLMYKIDNMLNKTYYNVSNGQMDRTEDKYGNVLTQYYYKTGQLGMAELSTSVDNQGYTTYYKCGKPQYETDSNENICKDYCYNGTELCYTFDHTLGQTTWYDINGNPLRITQNNLEVSCWFYSQSKLIGVWDDTKNTLTAYIRGDPVGTYMFFDKPTAELIQQLIDDGIIKKNYTN